MIFVFKGNRLSSCLTALLLVFEWTPRISFKNLECSNSNGSESLSELYAPHISLQYNRIGEINVSKSFS